MHRMIACVGLLLVSSTCQAALTINFTPTGNAAADAGFTLAGNYISSQFSDNVTINIAAGFANLGAGTLGQANSTLQLYSYSAWRAAMVADSSTATDATMVANLPTGNSFAVYMNRTSNNPNGNNSPTPYLDNNVGQNNTSLLITTANARALGLSTSAATDATITFNSQFGFDFNPADGIGGGLIDFVGVAIHEIMHAMGFTSGVDVLDTNSPSSGTTNLSDDQYTFISGLDFTRHSTASVAAGADLDWTADNRSKFFSIDGGTTNLTPGGSGGWSTGNNYGDGSQASHWKDNLGLGIMDPTSAPAGNLNIVTALDLTALDAIGWSPLNNSAGVPEPSSLAILVVVAVAGWLLRSRI